MSSTSGAAAPPGYPNAGGLGSMVSALQGQSAPINAAFSMTPQQLQAIAQQSQFSPAFSNQQQQQQPAPTPDPSVMQQLAQQQMQAPGMGMNPMLGQAVLAAQGAGQ